MNCQVLSPENQKPNLNFLLPLIFEQMIISYSTEPFIAPQLLSLERYYDLLPNPSSPNASSPKPVSLIQVRQPCKFANQFASYKLQTMNSLNYELIEL